MVFKVGDRVRYLAQVIDRPEAYYKFYNPEAAAANRVVGKDVGTVVEIGYDDVWGTVYSVEWDDAPYGEVSPFTGQTYELNAYPAVYLTFA